MVPLVPDTGIAATDYRFRLGPLARLAAQVRRREHEPGARRDLAIRRPTTKRQGAVSTPDWRDVLPVPPPGGRLHEAWMATFDQPDAVLLVEYLLPSLLGASHSLSQEVQERTLFFGELGTALAQLTVDSRSSRRHPPASANLRSTRGFGATSATSPSARTRAPYNTRSSGCFTGSSVARSSSTCTSHRRTSRDRRSERRSQAGWQASVHLQERATVNARRTWGDLVPFLEALGSSAGTVAKQRVERLVTLLRSRGVPCRGHLRGERPR